MERWILAFLVGHLLTLISPVLFSQVNASLTWLIIVFCLIQFTTAYFIYRHWRLNRFIVLLSGIITGCMYVTLMANIHLSNNFVTVKPQLFNVDGVVASVVIPQQKKLSTTFTLTVNSLEDMNSAKVNNPSNSPQYFAAKQIRLSWYKPDQILKQGDRLQGTVKLSKPHGYQNSFGFDFNQWLFAKHIIATGTVKGGTVKIEHQQQHQTDNFTLLNTDNAQQISIDRFIAKTEALSSQGILLAIGLGNRQLISSQQFELYNQMGISHLLAISGLHIGIIFIFLKQVLSWIIKLLSYGLTTRFCIGHTATHCLVLLFLWLYIYLIGLPVSATRAALFVTLWVVLDVSFIHTNKLRLLLLVALFSLVFEPFSPLTAAWWLTFTAVLGIMIFLQQTPILAASNENSTSLKKRLLSGLIETKNKFIYLVKFQAHMTIWMMPIVLYWFGGVSLSSFITNLIAIPLFSLVVVPSVFVGTLGVVFDIELLTTVLIFPDIIVTYVIDLFSQYSVFHYWLNVANGMWLFVLLVIALGLIYPILFSVIPFKKTRVSVTFSLIFVGGMVVIGSSIKLESNKLKMHVLDVGQGTSVIFQQGNSAFVYDLGPVYPSGFSATQAVVKPMLVGLGITQLQPIIISHNDSDHYGDIKVLNHLIDDKTKLIDCSSQRTLHQFGWLDVDVEILWPLPQSQLQQIIKRPLSKNDSSCVIKVLDKKSQKRVLLTGDITKKVEKILVKLHQAGSVNLTADIMMSAHHGSKHSSLIEFINAVDAKIVFHSAGVNNQFGFPTQEVIQRFNSSRTPEHTLHKHSIKNNNIQQHNLTKPNVQNVSSEFVDSHVKQYSTNQFGMLTVTFPNCIDERVMVKPYLNPWQPFWKKQNPFSFQSEIR